MPFNVSMSHLVLRLTSTEHEEWFPMIFSWPKKNHALPAASDSVDIHHTHGEQSHGCLGINNIRTWPMLLLIGFTLPSSVFPLTQGSSMPPTFSMLMRSHSMSPAALWTDSRLQHVLGMPFISSSDKNTRHLTGQNKFRLSGLPNYKTSSIHCQYQVKKVIKHGILYNLVKFQVQLHTTIILH